MNIMNLINKGENIFPSELINPFKKDKISGISIFYRKVLFEDRWEWSSYINFENGNTSGKQEFKNENLAKLIYEMQNFIDRL